MRSAHGDVNLSGIDGCVDVESQSGNIFIAINKLRGKSQVKALCGCVSMNINPEVSVTCELVSTNKKNADVAIDVKSPFFRLTEGALHHGFVRGVFEGVTEDLSQKGRSALMSGKIDLVAAKSYALHAERFNNRETTVETSFQSSSPVANDNTKNSISDSILPEISITANESISIKSLSWKDTIKQKYGLLF